MNTYESNIGTLSTKNSSLWGRILVALLGTLCLIVGGSLSGCWKASNADACTQVAEDFRFPMATTSVFNNSAFDRQVTLMILDCHLNHVPREVDQEALEQLCPQLMVDAMAEFKRFQILFSAEMGDRFQKSQDSVCKMWLEKGYIRSCGTPAIATPGLPYDYGLQVSISFKEKDYSRKDDPVQKTIYPAEIVMHFIKQGDPFSKPIYTLSEVGHSVDLAVQAGGELKHKSPYLNAATSAIRTLAQRLQAEIPLYGKVQEMDGPGTVGTQAIIDVGYDHGLRPQECLLIFRAKSGLEGGFKTPLAHATISAGESTHSQLSIVELKDEQKPIQVGDYVVGLGVKQEH